MHRCAYHLYSCHPFSLCLCMLVLDHLLWVYIWSAHWLSKPDMPNMKHFRSNGLSIRSDTQAETCRISGGERQVKSTQSKVSHYGFKDFNPEFGTVGRKSDNPLIFFSWFSLKALSKEQCYADEAPRSWAEISRCKFIHHNHKGTGFPHILKKNPGGCKPQASTQ